MYEYLRISASVWLVQYIKHIMKLIDPINVTAIPVPMGVAVSSSCSSGSPRSPGSCDSCFSIAFPAAATSSALLVNETDSELFSLTDSGRDLELLDSAWINRTAVKTRPTHRGNAPTLETTLSKKTACTESRGHFDPSIERSVRRVLGPPVLKSIFECENHKPRKTLTSLWADTQNDSCVSMIACFVHLHQNSCSSGASFYSPNYWSHVRLKFHEKTWDDRRKQKSNMRWKSPKVALWMIPRWESAAYVESNVISPTNKIEHVRSPSVNEDDWEVLDQHIHEFSSPTDPDFKNYHWRAEWSKADLLLFDEDEQTTHYRKCQTRG